MPPTTPAKTALRALPLGTRFVIRSDGVRPTVVARGVVLAPGREGGILCRMREYAGSMREAEAELSGRVKVEPA